MSFDSFLKLFHALILSSTQNDEIVACGGHGYHGKKQAVVLCWGMVHADFHKQRLGEFLLIERLKQIYKDFGETLVQIDTSQHSQGFFERYGFQVKEVYRELFRSWSSSRRHGTSIERRMPHTLLRSLNI